jgi:HEAT repeat protein
VPFLIDVFESPNADVRQQAAFALGEIGQPINFIIPALIDNLDDKEWNVRRVSVRALLNIGQPAVPQLIEALNRGNRETQRTARIALDQMAHRKR